MWNPLAKALMVALHLYTLPFLFVPIVVLSSTMQGNNINCNGTTTTTTVVITTTAQTDPGSPKDDDEPGRKCFVPCPPTQNDDFKLEKQKALGNGSYYCSYLSDDHHGSCQYSTKSARLEVEQGDPGISCAPCLDVIPSCSDCDEPPCTGCEECFEILHTCQGDD